jgi:hypothetical protein
MIDSLLSLLIVPFLVLVPGFEDEFADATNEDLSVTLYAWNNDTTTLGPDNLPDKMTPLKGYAKELALSGPNGVQDILEKVPLWWKDLPK